MKLSSEYLVMVLLSVTTLQAEDSDLDPPIESIEGSFTLTSDRKGYMVKLYAETLGATPEQVKQIQEHPTVGNFQVKLLDKKTEEIELTVDTLLGKITTKLKPSEWDEKNPKAGELAWWDGTKCSVGFMTTFDGDYETIRNAHMNVKNGNKSFGLIMGMGKGVGEWQVKLPRMYSLMLHFK